MGRKRKLDFRLRNSNQPELAEPEAEVNHRSRHDWASLKLEYITGEMGAMELAKTHEISYATMVSHSAGWERERKALQERAARRAIKQIENRKTKDMVRKFDDYRELIHAAKEQLGFWIKKNSKDGKVTQAADIGDLEKYVRALDTSLKSESFLEGGPTERFETRNIHAEISDIIALLEKDKDAHV